MGHEPNSANGHRIHGASSSKERQLGLKPVVEDSRVMLEVDKRLRGVQKTVRAMRAWQLMIACCNDGTRPMVFKIERVDIPENDEEARWLARQDFRNGKDDACSFQG